MTRDLAQVSQAEELIALNKTRLSLVTWRKPIEDPIAEWGQLLAYMPEVRKRIAKDGPSIFVLPAPRLKRDSIESTHTRAHESANEQRISFHQLRSTAIKVMRSELGRLGADHLAPLLD